MKYLLLFFIQLFSFVIFAQKKNISFKDYSIENGLSQTNISSIVQDYKGFIWLGTQDGLNLFDGYNFVHYKHDPDDFSSINSNSIICIYETKDKKLWIGTNQGINFYLREKNSFIRYALSYDLKELGSVRDILQDKTGNLWICTSNGLAVFSSDKNCFEFVNTNYDKGKLKLIYEDYRNNLWLGTTLGLKKYDKNTNQIIDCFEGFQKAHLLKNVEITSIIEDENKIIWVSTFGNSVLSIDLEKEMITPYQFINFQSSNLSNDYVWTIKKDKKENFYAGTENGLFIFSVEKNKFIPFKHSLINKNSWKEYSIVKIFFDRTGLMWLATTKGFRIVNETKKKFIPYLIQIPDTTDININSVWGFSEDSKKNLWIATKSGLVKLDKQQNKYQLFKLEGNTSVKDNNILCITKDNNGIFWLGTWLNGLVSFNPKTEKFKQFINPYDSSVKVNNNIHCLVSDKNGTIWYGTSNGLYQFNQQSQKFTKFVNIPNDSNSITHNRLSYLIVDKQNNIWIATAKGLSVYNQKNKKIQRISSFAKHLKDLEEKAMIGLYQDSKENIWICTMYGLYIFSPKTKDIQHYSSKNGLANDFVYGVLEDNSGRMWISTNKGLTKFDVETKTFTNYETNDGLQSNEFNSCAFYKSESGELFFGGINGYNRFFPENINQDQNIPQIVITDFKIMNKKVPIGKFENSRTILSKSISETKEIELSFKDQLISFEFAALHFGDVSKNRFKYKLDGFDSSWIDIGTRNFVTYTNIPAGDFVLRIIGSNYDNVWNQEGVRIKIKIVPPIWHSKILYITIILLIIAIFIIYPKYRERKLRKYNQDLEKKVEERTAAILAKEEELIEAIEFADSIISNAKDAIIVIDLNGNFVRVNEEFIKLSGYSEEELMKMNYLQITPEKWYNNLQKGLEKLLSGKKIYTEKDFINKSGNTIHVSISASLLKNKAGQAISYMAIISDISERKKNELELEKYRNHLEQLVQLRTSDLEQAKLKAEKADKLKSAFLANMSHEIRTPMNSIIGFADLLKDPEISEETRIDFINNINNSGSTLLHLINDIIDIAKIEADQIKIEMAECYVDSILKEIVGNLNNLKQKYKKQNVEIKLNLPKIEGFFAINTDPVRLMQILTNLLNNALKFTDEGYIEVGYSIENLSKDKLILFFVKDTGIGISQDKLNSIFERFVKLDEDRAKLYSGAGLGLTISRKLIELFGGKIWADSKPGQGSAFYFTLPYIPVINNNTDLYTEEDDSQYNWSNFTFLIVEDEELNFMYLKKIFEKTQAKILRACDGSEAIKTFIEYKNLIDIILMDIRMPVLDGLEATREIRKIDKNIPIIAQTAFAMPGDKNLCIEAGCNDYIAKPYNTTELLEFINKFFISN